METSRKWTQVSNQKFRTHEVHHSYMDRTFDWVKLLSQKVEIEIGRNCEPIRSTSQYYEVQRHHCALGHHYALGYSSGFLLNKRCGVVVCTPGPWI